jgi:hypothetical protein
MTQAIGTFNVQMAPQATDDGPPGSTLGRLSLAKQFQGDLEGASRGEMLTAMTPVKGSAGYVAIERVTGTLHGRTGSFVLLHRGIMTGGAQELSITIVPDSGTDGMVGLSGSLAIKIVDGQHSYVLDYETRA